MRPTEFSVDTIIALLRKQTIVTLPEVMVALGPRASRRTAFRKLRDLDARTSYSHRGSYYTLDALADFDEHGLWSFAGVRFSRSGTLIATAESLVNHAEAGYFVDELDNLLTVGTQDPLHKLVRDGRLTRHKLAGQFLYCAADRAHQAHHLRARRLLMATPGLVRPLPEADLMPEELRAAIVLFASLLDERQRRLFAGLEALKCGWGGDRRIARLLGIDPSTVAAGRRQDLHDWRQGHRRADAGVAHHTRQLPAQMELHHRTHVTKNGSYSCAEPNPKCPSTSPGSCSCACPSNLDLLGASAPTEL
ncbi:MAG: hypothetical protein OXG44_20190 [Gammaproteobacteria bacterium]|nr:hypothetical protein [Gammaproteobacteria bacterium]